MERLAGFLAGFCTRILERSAGFQLAPIGGSWSDELVFSWLLAGFCTRVLEPSAGLQPAVILSAGCYTRVLEQLAGFFNWLVYQDTGATSWLSAGRYMRVMERLTHAEAKPGPPRPLSQTRCFRSQPPISPRDGGFGQPSLLAAKLRHVQRLPSPPRRILKDLPYCPRSSKSARSFSMSRL